MRCVWIFILSLGLTSPRYITNPSLRRWLHRLPVPWVGVLSYRETRNSSEAIAIITLINTKTALANANEVAIIRKHNIRKTTKAMFLTDAGVVQYCKVINYTLHPEFDEDTLNTIALIQLDYDEKKFQWVLMAWPREDEQMYEQEGDIFAMGYTDQHQVLEQVIHKMEFVNLSDCDSFYKQEQLDHKWMRPTEFQCFRKMYSSEPCVFESGMVLAAHHNNSWKLLGISVLGPGCSLPSRFLDFARFMPWVEVLTRSTRRMNILETQFIWPNYDKIILQKIDDSSLVMRPYDGTEVIRGDCDHNDGVVMYNEESSFHAPDMGIGLYGLSIWDRRFNNVTCALLTVTCLQRSIKPFSFKFGLVQYDEDLEGLVKSIPIVERNTTIGPKILHIKDGQWLHWFVRPREHKASSVVFKFEFYREASIKLTVYGDRIVYNTVDVTRSTMPDNMTRSRRPHPTHTPPKKG